jgi:hypothetical protein
MRKKEIWKKLIWGGVGIIMFSLTTLMLSNCNKNDNDDNGMCYGAGTDIYYTGECHDDWTREDCEEFDDLGVNGTSWTFVAGGSCSDL